MRMDNENEVKYSFFKTSSKISLKLALEVLLVTYATYASFSNIRLYQLNLLMKNKNISLNVEFTTIY